MSVLLFTSVPFNRLYSSLLFPDITYEVENPLFIYIVTCRLTNDGVRIGSWIYWSLTSRNYSTLADPHTTNHSTLNLLRVLSLSLCVSWQWIYHSLTTTSSTTVTTAQVQPSTHTLSLLDIVYSFHAIIFDCRLPELLSQFRLNSR
jgi:hypothetical protein